MTQRTTVDIVAQLILTMQREPASLKTLLMDLGQKAKRSDNIKPHLDGLRSHGLVRIAGWQRQRPIYGWQSAPFALPDEPKPPKRDPNLEPARVAKRKTTAPLTEREAVHIAAARKQRRATVQLGPNSVFALAVA